MKMKSWLMALALGMVLCFSVAVQAALVDPAGLSPGDTYHIVFATSDTRDATSADIADYNDFVNTVAAAAGSWVKDLSTTWKAIASTQDVDAINNAPIGGPVFRVDGVKVADNSADLWDGSLDAAIHVTETGGTPTDWIWTGSNQSGTEFIQSGGPDDGDSLALGTVDNTHSTVGASSNSGVQWMVGTAAAQSSELSLYALSGELTFVPEPTSLGLLTIAGMGLLRRRGK